MEKPACDVALLRTRGNNYFGNSRSTFQMFYRQFHFKFVLSMALSLVFLNQFARGETPAQRAEKKFVAARSAFQKDPDNAESAWQFGRACFDWAEFAEDDDQREAIAVSGIDACRSVVENHPDLAQGHYYLAMNLGQLARTKSFGALKLVREMEKEFARARELDENFDFAGPDRNLGLLYFQAPGWPTSIGSRSKARRHLERAAKLKPGYPENHLNLIEAYLKWGDDRQAQRELESLKELWPQAKKELSGDDWESSWTDWEKRREKFQSAIAKQ